MNRKFSLILAVGALIASTLACSLGEPSLSNVRTAKDQDANQPSSVFAPGDTVYVVSDLANGVKGNEVSSKWYLVSADGYEPQLLDEGNIVLDEDQLSYSVYFYFPPPSGAWPVGSYKVEVYFNGALNSTVEFTVQ